MGWIIPFLCHRSSVWVDVCVCVSRSVMFNSLWPHGRSPGSSVHGILQTRIIKWVAILCSRGSSWPWDWTRVSYIAGRFFIVRATGMWETISHFSTVSFIFPYSLKMHLMKVRSETLSCDLGLIPGHSTTPATGGVFVRSWPFLKGRAHSWGGHGRVGDIVPKAWQQSWPPFLCLLYKNKSLFNFTLLLSSFLM